MRVLICGINYAPDLIGVPKYNTELAESLVLRGHEVRVVTAPPYYPDWTVPEAYRRMWYAGETLNGVRLTRAPIYVPGRPSGGKRLLHHASFAVTSIAPVVWHALRFAPDVVFAVAPSLLSAPLAAAAARLCGATSWLHVQDLEVDAAFELGLLRNAGARRAMLAAERTILRRFDRVSTISPPMMRRLREKGVAAERLREIRNWVDTAAIDRRDRMTAIRARLGLGERDIVVLYSGAMSRKQGLDLVIEAAARTASAQPRVHYVLCGNGPHRAELEALAAGRPDVHFLDLQPAARLPELLATADIHVMPQRAEAADLVLPSKLSGMFASARPIVVMAAPGTGVAQETEGAGLLVPPGEADGLADAILRLAADPALRRQLGTEARLRAERLWDRLAIIRKIEREFVASGRRIPIAGDAPVPEKNL
ncbi:WcaI family glycosyltransferase [Rhodoplanes azumiensis]|uniref:WcaI family glycosyltransferase n=1 Tax=Rhodoplanes azumiensis TaxID=1897628 RepID=A0ABW5ANR0_9BRAD